MRTNLRLLVPAALLPLVLVACTRNSNVKSPAETVAALKVRAASDFACTPSDIKTTTVDDRTKIVTGCGRRATYVEHCETCTDTGLQMMTGIVAMDRCNCTWTLDGAASSVAQSN
jgi:hypothetical protein